MGFGVKEVGFMNGVLVDSVYLKKVRPNEGGIKEVLNHTQGIRIYWNFGQTLVPWANVAYVVEG